MQRIILLVEPVKNDTLYFSFQSISECMEFICGTFELHLKLRNTSCPTITYTSEHLYEWIDEHLELSCIVPDDDVHVSLVLKDKDWIKANVFYYLKQFTEKRYEDPFKKNDEQQDS